MNIKLDFEIDFCDTLKKKPTSKIKMNITKKILTVLVLGLLVFAPAFALVSDVSAGNDNNNSGTSESSVSPLSQPPHEPPEDVITDIDQIWNLVLTARNYFWGFITVMVVFSFGMAAYQFLTSSGDLEKAKRGKDMVLYGLIGVVIIILTAGITELVKTILEN